ncbi:MAG: DNA polymerase I [Acidiferrobacterales bacterium]
MAKINKTKKPLILVDGSSYLYRAYHAMAKTDLSNSAGEPTGATYGTVNMVRKLLAEYEPEYIVVVFDAKGKNFRHELYPEYKAHRPPMPEDLRPQVATIHGILAAMGLKIVSIEGVEADDVIGTLAHYASGLGLDTVISTGDKDMAQLVTKQVSLIDTMKGVAMDEQGVLDKFGVKPAAMIDYLALVGDTADNIPGVPKVGPKTASKWLQQYGDLDTIIKHAEEIKGKVGENLRAHLGQLPLSHQLATIKCDVDLKLKLDDLARQAADEKTLAEYYKKYEFRTWLAELGKSPPVNPGGLAPVNADYDLVLDMKALKKWLKRLETAKLFAIDTETTSLNAIAAELVGLSFSDKVGQAAYVPVAHDYPGAPAQLDRDEVLKLFKPLLENENNKKVGQNLKYDKSVFANYDISLCGISFDTMLESYVIDSTASRHNMDSLALKYLGHNTIKFEDVAGKGKKQLQFNEVDLELAGPYAAEDADITLQLHEHLWPLLEKQASLKKVFHDIEMPLLSVLSRMERNGVKLDVDMLHAQSSELAHKMIEIEQQAHDLAGQTFNLASPKQIQEILFDKLELPILKKTPKGQPSTAEDVLQELALDYPLPQLILDHRGMSKLKSTYTDKLPDMVFAKTGRVHTSYHQAVAATGRLSSSDPNLQNIPVRTPEGRRIRQAFIPEPGFKILSADYSQIELRIMAHLSQDQGLCSAFERGEDVHRATAAEVFSVAPDQVSKEQRRHAKAINFGLIYGMSAFGLARQIKVDRKAAQLYIDRYFERYPGVKKYMDDTREKAHDTGFVETVFGRRLYLPEINSSNHLRRQYAERTAINAPMQGTAADLIKKAMLSIDDWLQVNNSPVSMIMQVHDELVFEVPEQEVETISELVNQHMMGVAELSVPLIVEVGVGDNWDQAH